MNMPMIPEAIEHAAPTRNAIPVRIPSAAPKVLVSATLAVSATEMSTASATATTRARTAIVEYWRRMKATAPSKIVAATSSIAFVPVSRRRTSRARKSANAMAIRPAGRMMSWSELGSTAGARPPCQGTGVRSNASVALGTRNTWVTCARAPP